MSKTLLIQYYPETIIKTQSYTNKFPKSNCIVKIALKKQDWNKDSQFKTQVVEEAIYEDGFVSLDGGKSYALASNFLFHKLKRSKLC